jgi:hypothetical protein
MNSAAIPAFEEPPQVSSLLMARYSREELYEKVWTLTMQIVAKEYGVSGGTLGRTCRELHVPVPGVGYWNKKAANRPVAPRPPLPVIRVRPQRRTGTSRAPKPRTIQAFERPSQVSPLLLARYDRRELYEKVWTIPIRKVAKEYGVSDAAIGKTCRKLCIPVPGTGYWNKKAANRPVEPQPPLPQLVLHCPSGRSTKAAGIQSDPCPMKPKVARQKSTLSISKSGRV